MPEDFQSTLRGRVERDKPLLTMLAPGNGERPAFQVNGAPREAVLLAQSHSSMKRQIKFRLSVRERLSDFGPQVGFFLVVEKPDSGIVFLPQPH